MRICGVYFNDVNVYTRYILRAFLGHISGILEE